MNKIQSALMGLGLGMISAASTAGDCIAPEVPRMPDGATAAYEDMIAGQKAVKEFQAANLEYMNCLDPQITAATAKAQAEGATDADKTASMALSEQYNGAVSREEELAGQFNTEIREYKAANPE